MRAWVLACGSLLFVARAHADDLPAVPSPDAKTKLTGTVLVWQDATLIVDPTPTPHMGGPKPTTLQLAQLVKPRADVVGHVIPMKVVGMSGDLVEVETLDKGECTGVTVDGLVKHLRVLVARTDIAPVVTKKFSAKYKDGSRIDVGVGVPVVPTSDGSYLVPVDVAQLPVAIPATSVGFSYRAATPIPTPKRKRSPFQSSSEVQSGTTVSFADRSFTSDLDQAQSDQIETKDKISLFSLDEACVHATVVVPTDHLSELQQGLGTIGIGQVTPTGGDVPEAFGGDGLLHGVSYVPAGTPLFVGTRKIGVLAVAQDYWETGATLLQNKPEPAEYCYDITPQVVAPKRPFSHGLPNGVRACAPASTKLKYRK